MQAAARPAGIGNTITWRNIAVMGFVLRSNGDAAREKGTWLLGWGMPTRRPISAVSSGRPLRKSEWSDLYSAPLTLCNLPDCKMQIHRNCHIFRRFMILPCSFFFPSSCKIQSCSQFSLRRHITLDRPRKPHYACVSAVIRVGIVLLALFLRGEKDVTALWGAAACGLSPYSFFTPL